MPRNLMKKSRPIKDNRERKHTIIIGAGPTGLGAGWRLNEQKSHWSMYEAKPYVGGLSASFVDPAGFTWDVGGHVLFSHYPYFDQVVEQALRGEYYQHERESWIRILQTWVPYPFQNNIRHLPDDALQECLSGLREQKNYSSAAQNLVEWMNLVFGKGIVKYFMEPYNRKVWGVPLETMSRKWIGERVSVVDLSRIEKNIADQKDDVNWGPNNLFKFPHSGGTGAIFNGIADFFRKQIHCNHEVVSVDLNKKEVLFQNGAAVAYDALITTMPIDRFVSCCTKTPESISKSSSRLTHNSGLIVGLGIAGQREDSKCWMYFPEDNCPFYRVTNFHNYSPAHVPGSRTNRNFSLMCETTYSPTKPVDKDRIIAETVNGLVASGMLSRDEKKNIVSRYLIDIPYSYPVPTLQRDESLAEINYWLETHDIYSRGRFGAWKYEIGNMDHSFMQGVEVVDRLLLGKEERTVHGKVN
jgi:protoporphyrinogen oxidase